MRWFELIIRFVFRSFSRAMGCFFACFRVRNNRHLPTTTTVSSSRFHKPNDVVLSRNRLSTLFLSEEREDSKRDDGKNFGEGSQRDDSRLKDQAKFLKACGTLASTPDEIRKASEKLKMSPSCGKDSELSRSHFWLPNSSAGKVQLDSQPFNPPTPKQHCEEWGKRTDSLKHTPSSCMSNAQNTDSTEGSRTGSLHTLDRTEKNTAYVSPWPSATHAQRNKSIRFECDTDLSSFDLSEYGGWHIKKTESSNNEVAYKPSPYPTPLKLSEEMQTPGTVYPAKFDDLPNGKPRVQSQFVYPIDNVGENVSRSKIHKEEDLNPKQDSRKLGESIEQPQNATSTPAKGLKKVSYENESKVEESLSSWLKPASVILEERNKRMEIAYSQTHKTPADRPIIGMVAAHWNEDEDSHVSPPKWWDGNGIPNSTNKYKEDQKVSWHATPFEERLEKALSEETFISQRKDVCGKPVVYDENEESDTALSQLQSSTHPQSVMSF